MRINKRGILGVSLSTIAMTIFVIVVLIVFVLGAGLVKSVDGAKAGIRVFSETDVGLGNIFDYILEDYAKITKLRFLLVEGNSVEGSLSEVKYEE